MIDSISVVFAIGVFAIGILVGLGIQIGRRPVVGTPAEGPPRGSVPTMADRIEAAKVYAELAKIHDYSEGLAVVMNAVKAIIVGE